MLAIETPKCAFVLGVLYLVDTFWLFFFGCDDHSSRQMIQLRDWDPVLHHTFGAGQVLWTQSFERTPVGRPPPGCPTAGANHPHGREEHKYFCICAQSWLALRSQCLVWQQCRGQRRVGSPDTRHDGVDSLQPCHPWCSQIRTSRSDPNDESCEHHKHTSQF